MRIGFLGLGRMGTPMALRLIAAGHDLSVWNRSEARIKPLVHEGAIAAGTPAEAELGADAVMTMLFDDQAYEEVVFGSNGLLDALSPGGLHISCSTISVRLSARLTDEYARRHIAFVAAPVFGQPNAAEEGGLWTVAAGAEDALGRARPLLEAFSRGITVVGKEPKQAHAVRLGGGFLLQTLMHSLREASAVLAQQGIEAHMLFEAVSHAVLQRPVVSLSARIVLEGLEHFVPSVDTAAKDLRLLRETEVSRDARASLVAAMAEIYAQALRNGSAA